MCKAAENQPGLQHLLGTICPKYVTAEEARLICEQFRCSFKINQQVLWSGMNREKAQKWADSHQYQTLTTAMGPLRYLEKSKGRKRRSKFMKGASAIFSWFISQGDWVVILLPLPPDQFHPSGSTSLQDFEIPIVKGLLRDGSVKKIDVFHPEAKTKEARNSSHQLWPCDETKSWVDRFGGGRRDRAWRAVKTGIGTPKNDWASAQSTVAATTKAKPVKKKKKQNEKAANTIPLDRSGPEITAAPTSSNQGSGIAKTSAAKSNQKSPKKSNNQTA
ncbi:hypothetical protein CT0861_11727 [Colletotrichum tofieldiae]|uniref:Uncharacterized protein n=1 Tax=Colletotrichum tofieldiae TaxID=708197 RepID=A0A161VKI9_9PEZI|nr:hypothetical protein CT0861_11727 [Colletotrichum tofieldiae]